MADKPTTRAAAKPAKPGREDRLKAALKANLARRKAQARAKAQSAGGAPDGDTKNQAEKPAKQD